MERRQLTRLGLTFAAIAVASSAIIPASATAGTAAGRVRLAELLRAGRPLLLDLAGRDDLVQVASGWADRLDVVRAKTDHEAEALLVRPDGYVAWVPGVTGHPLRESLERWLGTGAAESP
ncbi:hypothetical protein [Nonomuraea sp. NPDC049784]|uniref:aromatic-ring hydroxylase C-terminal domain-containing protein n=1 Tax=Nonomuraea sp. NPDC049784 TaxID=3154361 RepID=UPI0033C51475